MATAQPIGYIVITNGSGTMRPDRLLVTALTAALTATGAVAEIPTQSGLSMYIARMVGTALPYTEETRWESYLTISRLADTLRREDRASTEIATLTTDTFPEFPLLVLTDEDGDHKADFYAYYDAEREETTLEFGAFFAMAGDPEPAWLVFNSGMLFEDLQADELVAFWATYHWVDRNGDGRFDLCIANGMDTDGDGVFLERDTVWLFDDDDDGLVDRAETNVFGHAKNVEPVDGAFRFSGALLRDIELSAPLFEFWDAIAADIREGLAGVAR